MDVSCKLKNIEGIKNIVDLIFFKKMFVFKKRERRVGLNCLDIQFAVLFEYPFRYLHWTSSFKVSSMTEAGSS